MFKKNNGLSVKYVNVDSKQIIDIYVIIHFQLNLPFQLCFISGDTKSAQPDGNFVIFSSTFSIKALCTPAYLTIA